MLCSVCKKNQAVIFVKEVNSQFKTGLCIECAKKKGINPMQSMMDSFKNLDPEMLNNMNKQFEEMLQDVNPDELEDSPFSAFSFGSFDKLNENDENTNKDKSKKKTKTKSLDIYGTNLTKKAENNELDIVIGRDKELQRVIQILNRRSKNNPALIGEPGVGKTALVNALALAIASKQVPHKLIDKQVYLLDMTSIVSGTQFRGQFESRIKGIIDECKENKNIILAIDEVHSIVGAEHDNSMNAGNMLKPALANGDIQLIGATTLKEYRKYIEKDAALDRRFQPVIIDEPSISDSIEILKGIKKYYEDYHKVSVSDDIITSCVELSTKYIHDRFLPDKAIDLLDEACARVNLNDILLVQIKSLEIDIENISKQIEELTLEGANNYYAKMDANGESLDPNPVDYEKLAKLTEKECKLKEKLDKLNKSFKSKEVTYENLACVIELWTKIPVTKIVTSEKEKLLNLKKNLSKRIIGQENAIDKLSSAILRKRAGLSNIEKPPSFIFVGPTGVGKTALVKQLAYELFDNENSIIKLDMSEYSEAHSTSKLIGSPPGYVGYDEAGNLTEKVRRNPYSIILFDEIEKAHNSIYNILLQILDEGKLTDSQGRTVSFKHTIVILTSNLGTNFKNDTFGFNNNLNILTDKVNESLKEFFTPEFLNRIDDTIVFNRLDKNNILKISNILINEFISETKKKGFNFKVSDNIIEYIAKIGYNDKFGARPIKRAIQDNLENVIALMYIKEEIKPNINYLIDYTDNKVTVNEYSVLVNTKIDV